MFKEMKICNKYCKYMIWDTPRYMTWCLQSNFKKHYRNACDIFVVFDVTDQGSFELKTTTIIMSSIVNVVYLQFYFNSSVWSIHSFYQL